MVPDLLYVFRDSLVQSKSGVLLTDVVYDDTRCKIRTSLASCLFNWIQSFFSWLLNFDPSDWKVLPVRNIVQSGT